MKKNSIFISILSFMFSLMFLLVSSGTNAEAQDEAKNDLIAALHLETTSLLGPNGNSNVRKERAINPLPAVFVPLQEGLHAFLDLASPPHPGLLAKDSRGDYRAVVGFHFRLN